MKDFSKYQGIIPAFYACYDEKGDISPAAVRALTEHFIQKGVKGVYVGGSSGECIYQSVAERKLVLENVMAVAKGKLTVIAHVACNNTADSQVLAAHAQRGLPAFSIYGHDVQDASDTTVPADVAEKILRFARGAVAVGWMKNKAYVNIGAIAMGIAGSYCDADVLQKYLGLRAEWVDEVEILRRIRLQYGAAEK